MLPFDILSSDNDIILLSSFLTLTFGFLGKELIILFSLGRGVTLGKLMIWSFKGGAFIAFKKLFLESSLLKLLILLNGGNFLTIVFLSLLGSIKFTCGFFKAWAKLIGEEFILSIGTSLSPIL